MVISPTLDFSRAISSSRSSRSRSFRAVAAPASARSRHSVSLAIETFVSRATSSSGSPRVNASLKLLENQRFEIVGFPALLGRILWFDPRREYSSIPTANSRSRRAQGLSRLAASSRPAAGLGLDWPEHGGILDRLGAGGAHHIIGKFKPLVLGEIHAAGNILDDERRGRQRYAGVKRRSHSAQVRSAIEAPLVLAVDMAKESPRLAKPRKAGE